jgi:2-polyprenyl-3-methyl-5-hydroxy-6-metoxy-1,4-benzoquinol methylase
MSVEALQNNTSSTNFTTAAAVIVNQRNLPLKLTFARCCLCGIDDSQPVAVGEDFEYRTSPDEFLAVQCRNCGLVYLNPRPADEEAGRIYPDDYHAFQFKPAEFGFVYRVRRWLEARRLLSWCRGLPANARILDVGCGDGFHLGLLREFGKSSWILEGVDVDPRAAQAALSQGLTIHQGSVEELKLEPGTYHLILMVMTIEHLPNPTATLQTVAKLLAPGGRVVIVTDNVGSPDFSIFGGRHWGGYHFPRHTYLFNRVTIKRLAAVAGLQVERVVSAMSPVNWVYSFRNWLDDWRGPRWLVNWLSLKSVIPLAFFTLLDMPLSMLGYGAILHATFRKPINREEQSQ